MCPGPLRAVPCLSCSWPHTYAWGCSHSVWISKVTKGCYKSPRSQLWLKGDPSRCSATKWRAGRAATGPGAGVVGRDGYGTALVTDVSSWGALYGGGGLGPGAVLCSTECGRHPESKATPECLCPQASEGAASGTLCQGVNEEPMSGGGYKGRARGQPWRW